MDILLLLLIIGVLVGLFQAWNIGANDVANAMGTSVGSKSITLKQAIIIAGIFEFCGAVLVGSQVTKTVGKGIIDLSLFQGQAPLLSLGMVSALAGTGIWILIATNYELPVSTTHSIVGGVIGFGVISLGVGGIKWSMITQIVASWFVSPIMGGLVAYLMFILITKMIFNSSKPLHSFKIISPFLIFLLCVIMSLSILFKGLKNLSLDLSAEQALLWSVIIGLIGVAISIPLISRIKEPKYDKKGTAELRIEYNSVEHVFKYLQIITACCMAFAHGSNDAANAIGPLSIIVSIYQHNGIVTAGNFEVPFWILLLGGFGIVVGLATYGYKIIGTIGEKITELTPSRGFSAELAAATTVLLGSKLGLPISTTHTLVGSVIGVGMARGLSGINLKVIWSIMSSWLITLPFTAVLTMVIYKTLHFFLSISGYLV